VTAECSTSSRSGQAIPRALTSLVLLAVAAPAARADRLLFESYVGSRPAAAARIAPLIRTVFQQHGFTVDPEVLAMYFRDHRYRPGAVSPKLVDMLQRVERRAEDDFWDEKYLKVIDNLRSQILWMRQNPLVFASEPKHRETALRVLVFYALACDRQAHVLSDKPDDAAKLERIRDDTFAEVIRSFPSKVIAPRDFGEEGEKHFLRIRDQLNQAGRGKISVAVSESDAIIYINEVVQGTSKVTAGDFVPGVYRVLIVMPTGEGREYEVEVTPNQTARLLVDWSVDSLLVLDGYAGLKYRSEKEHAREAEIVHMLGQKHTNADLAATVTISYARGRFSVTGTSYETRTGKILHSGSVELTGTPSNDTMLNRLADCLVGQACIEGVLPVSHPEYTPPPEPIAVAPAPPPPAPPSTTAVRSAPAASVRSEYAAWTPTLLPAITMGVGTLVIAGGAVAYTHKHFNVNNPPSDGTDGRNPIVGVMLGGSLALGGGVYLWSRESLSASRLTAGALGVGVASVAAGVQLYLTAEKALPSEPRFIRPTATAGVVLGAAGLALTGAGLWFLHRDQSAPSSSAVAGNQRSASTSAWSPFVSAGPAQALAGCAGTF
jgi:hypothetical protein